MPPRFQGHIDLLALLAAWLAGWLAVGLLWLPDGLFVCLSVGRSVGRSLESFHRPSESPLFEGPGLRSYHPTALCVTHPTPAGRGRGKEASEEGREGGRQGGRTNCSQ